MNKTKIEWCDYTWNPVVGCKRKCSYCYARRIHQRFHQDIPFEELQFFENRLSYPLALRKSSRIFVGSMTDIEYWKPEWMYKILNIARSRPQHTFMFLTKYPYQYRDFEFPRNCWLGTTMTGRKHPFTPDRHIPNQKFISFEPLLENVGVIDLFDIKWVIIGAMTGPDSFLYRPKEQWIKHILKEARIFNIPVFMKNNLRPYWLGKLRQEFPVEGGD
jgi:protein gp37